MLAYFLAVQSTILPAVFFHHGPIERNTREDPVSARPRQDLSVQRGVRSGSSRSSYRTGSYRSVGAHGEFIARQLLHPLAIHHQHDDIGGLNTDLCAKASAAKSDRRRAGPSTGVAA